MSLFSAGAEFGLGHLRDAAQVLVTYVRKSTTLTDVPAIEGESPFNQETADQLTTVTRIKDFLIDAADLTSLGEPAEGDQLTRSGETYEVSSVGAEPCWRWSDQGQTRYRIHTKRV